MALIEFSRSPMPRSLQACCQSPLGIGRTSHLGWDKTYADSLQITGLGHLKSFDRLHVCRNVNGPLHRFHDLFIDHPEINDLAQQAINGFVVVAVNKRGVTLEATEI